MNKTIIVGRLTRDPEVRYTQSGLAYARFSLAVDRRVGKDKPRQADFIPCVAWGKLAEVIGNNLQKGRRIGVEGRIQTGSYEAKDGTRRNTFDINVEEMEFLDAPKGDAGRNYESPGPGYGQSIGEPIPEDDIPF